MADDKLDKQQLLDLLANAHDFGDFVLIALMPDGKDGLYTSLTADEFRQLITGLETEDSDEDVEVDDESVPHTQH